VATVLIIGASRGVGLETVKAALQAGHSVRALARSAQRIPIDRPKLEKMAGDALETATVKRALSGVGAVIQSLGSATTPKRSAVGGNRRFCVPRLHGVARARRSL
jgi:putative NADH-flavin reductase